MGHLKPAAGLVLLLSVFGSAAGAHFQMFFPDLPDARRGERIILVYRWGHPYEHDLFDAPRPERVNLLFPDGGQKDVTALLAPFTERGDGGKSVRVFRLPYAPTARGDHTFQLETPFIWMEEDREFLRDSVKVIVHAQAQRGWERALATDLEVVPLTRPYGLQPGMAFHLEALVDGKPLPGALVQVELYHPAPPAKLPPDEHITHTARTDPCGAAVCTLTEQGWWCLTVEREVGRREHAGISCPVRRRASLWVHVGGAIPLRPNK